MGYDATDVENLRIYTNKVLGNLIGARVWLIAGEGKPRKFQLRATFIVNNIDASDKPEFLTRVTGKEGQFLHPMPVLNGELWFDALKKAHGNFAFGFQPIDNHIWLAGLRDVLRAATSV